MSSNNKKGAKIRKALKSAARPLARIKGSGRNGFSPLPGEQPVVICRLQVLGCTDVLAKDSNGFSDPFVVVSILNTRHQTPVAKRTVNPVYAPKDATFDYPLYLSLADKLGVVEFIVWDKDLMSKDYLGEVSLPLEDWFVDRANGTDRAFAFDDSGNQPFSINLDSTRANTHATGSVKVKLGFVSPNPAVPVDFHEVFSELVKRSRPSLVSAPPTEGVGTVRSHNAAIDLEDDGGLSSESSDEEEDEEEASDYTTAASSPPTPPTPSEEKAAIMKLQTSGPKPIPPHLDLPASISGDLGSPTTPTPAGLSKTPMPPPTATPVPTTAKSSGFIPKMKFRRASSNVTSSTVTASTPTASTPSTPSATTPSSSNLDVGAAPSGKKKRFRKNKTHGEYYFGASNDIVGIVMLEIHGADDLPRLKNMTRTGWDMDPFVVISFGKKVFRTRVIRHSLNPVWDEKLLFHVRRYETSFKVQLSILDWDKLSSNDHVGDASFDVSDLIEGAPQPDPNTGLYAAIGAEGHPMKEYKLPLATEKDVAWEARHKPVITVKAKYQPYAALRQQFWRQYIGQYDTDDTRAISHLELTSMLDSLGSTLSRSTVNSFFTRHGKDPRSDELTMDETIQCLETELNRPDSEKRRVDEEDSAPDTSISATPILTASDNKGQGVALDNLDFSGPSHSFNNVGYVDENKLPPPPAYSTEPAETKLTEAAQGPPAAAGHQYSSSEDVEEDSSGSGSPTGAVATVTSTAPPTTKKGRFRRKKKATPDSTAAAAIANTTEDPFERVINVKNCPLCHRPRLNSKAEMDIVTHLAICASQDWGRVDRIVVGNFVTASQAQRKWYTKIIGKISSGDYRLGANSANIIVQNRMTGQLEEEKMQVYVRLGIRLLYKGAKSQMEGGRARGLLKSLSIKQGLKYDAPQSAADIPGFIEFHNLNVDEILDPLDSFKTFNEFFYRKLKKSARPVEQPDNPYRLVSAADCRMMAFETVSDATRLWIKGREFTVARLLGDAYKAEADKYTGGALAIFRLAPQDYHRFHSPVDGTIGPMTYIDGEYYTVNPQAIRTALDVYGENVRKIVPIDSPQFGRVMAVCIGAMMVGSIKTTVNEGDFVKRGDEFGYFAFGGSTIVILFEKGAVKWDEDLIINGKASLETLVRVGMGIGTGRQA
ncbi:Phosphatidylserine decarboxylase proenzyme 2 [Pleurotus pulmonarius]